MSAVRAGVALPLPRFVQIEPVGQCNLACRMCPVAYRAEGGPGTGKPPAFMSFDAFRRVLDQFPAVSELHLQGMGEPMLHPRFFDMVRLAAGRGIEVSTNSNLTALSPRRAQECVASGLRHLYASLDAAEAGAYEFIRVGARFDRVVRNLGWLLDARSGTAARLPGITVVAVAMRRNLEELPALVRFAHERGIEAVNVQHLAHDFTESTLPGRYRPMRAFVDRETLLAEDPARVARWFGEAREAAATLGVALRLPDPAPRPRPRGLRGPARCDWPWRRAYVSCSGDAMPCCMVATPDRMRFGNMVREGVEPVWNNEAYQAFRDRLDSDDPPEICRGCAVYKGTF